MGMYALTFLVFAGAASGFLLDREVCYGDLGCFNTQTIRSWSRPIVLLPEEPQKIGTKFFLYTQANPTKEKEQQLSRADPDSFTRSSFNGSKDTKIIIHGFTHSAHESWVQQMKDELLKFGDYNVIAVDWRGGAGFPYTQATANIRVVAAELTKLLEALFKDNSNMAAASVHIIGHSLGAHAASEVGTKIKGLGRITGLDPAEPYFEGAVEDVRLEKRDAEFVDIIHSDGSKFLGSLGMGYRTSIGHVDFYPNGGAEQPGCDKTASSRLLSSVTNGISGGVESLKSTFACSHQRATEYFTESINSKCGFRAYPCKSYDEFKQGKCLDCSGDKCSVMGFHADKRSARGNFYLMTHQDGKAPHCAYHYKVAVTTGSMDGKGYGDVAVTLNQGNGQTFGPVAMNDKPISIEPKQTLERLVLSTSDLGDVTGVTVSYTKDDCLTCFLSSDFVSLQSVEIISGENQSKTAYCGKNQSLATTQKRTVLAEEAGYC